MSKISVIVPVYNTEKYLRKTVDSLLNQTYKDLEILLIDDGSCDNSGKICEEYAQTDSRIKVVHQENQGLSAVRNRGIELATGEYLCFVDSDDFVETDTYEVFNNIIEKEKVDFINGGIRVFENNQEFIGVDYRIDPNRVINRAEIIDYLSNFKIQYASMVLSKVIRRDFLLAHNIRCISGLKIQEDFVFVLEMLLKADTIYFVDKYFYNYVKRTDSLTTKRYRKDIYKHFNTAYLKIKELYENASITGHEDQLIYYFSRYLLSTIKREKYNKASCERKKELRAIFETEMYKDIIKNINAIKKFDKKRYHVLKIISVLVKLKAMWCINFLISVFPDKNL